MKERTKNWTKYARFSIFKTPFAEAKKKFSEYVAKSGHAACRVIITRRDHPVALLTSMEDLRTIEQAEKRKGLISMIGKWSQAEELESALNQIVEQRHIESGGRHVSV